VTSAYSLVRRGGSTGTAHETANRGANESCLVFRHYACAGRQKKTGGSKRKISVL